MTSAELARTSVQVESNERVTPVTPGLFKEISEENLRFLFTAYGPTLNMKQLSIVLKATPASLDNKIRAGRCPVPTYREGGHRVADVRDVVAYLDRRRQEARQEFEQQQNLLSLPSYR